MEFIAMVTIDYSQIQLSLFQHIMLNSDLGTDII